MNELNYLEKIGDEQIREFVSLSLERYSNTSKVDTANRVADIVWKKFITLGYITDGVQQQFVDYAIAASLLYNVFYNVFDITTILLHRLNLKEIEERVGLDPRKAELIYEMIESHLGEKHPIGKFKPSPNSPGGTLAEAVWFVDTYPNM